MDPALSITISSDSTGFVTRGGRYGSYDIIVYHGGNPVTVVVDVHAAHTINFMQLRFIDHGHLGLDPICFGGSNPEDACPIGNECLDGGVCEDLIGAEAGTCTDQGGNIWHCVFTPSNYTPGDHAGLLMVMADIVGHAVNTDGDTASVLAGNRPWGIPTVSEWGLLIMALLVLGAGTVVLMRRRARVAA